MQETRFLAAVFAVAAVICSVSGCAHVHVDEDGTKHIVGLVYMSIPTDARRHEVQADSIKVTSLGLSLHQLGTGSAVAIGYHQSALTAFGSNACVFYPAQGGTKNGGIFR